MKLCAECGNAVAANRYGGPDPDLCPECRQREQFDAGLPVAEESADEAVTCAWCRDELGLAIDPGLSYGCCKHHADQLIEQALADRCQSKRPDQLTFSVVVFFVLVGLALAGLLLGATIATVQSL